jgi:hypothetical protein
VLTCASAIAMSIGCLSLCVALSIVGAAEVSGSRASPTAAGTADHYDYRITAFVALQWSVLCVLQWHSWQPLCDTAPAPARAGPCGGCCGCCPCLRPPPPQSPINPFAAEPVRTGGAVGGMAGADGSALRLTVAHSPLLSGSTHRPSDMRVAAGSGAGIAGGL